MLQLRVHGEPATIAAVVKGLDALPGVRHLSVVGGGGDGAESVTADVDAAVADTVLAVLERLAVPVDDVVLLRVDRIGATSGLTDLPALVWADLVNQALIQARAPARYFVFMAAAGVVAAFGVINLSPVLIVGAMAISPDLLPITAACTGLVLRRLGLFRRGLLTLAAGLLVTAVLAAAVTAFLNLFDLLPAGFTLHGVPTGQTHVNASTFFVALAAGVAGMLAVETRANSAVGVAISVTTIPAAAFLGVALGVGDLTHSLSGLVILGVNVAMMLVGGSSALALQRAAAQRRTRAVADPLLP